MPGLGLGLGRLGLQILQARARALGAGPEALSPGLGPGFLIAKDKKHLEWRRSAERQAWRAWHFSSPSPKPAQALCRARLGLTKPGPGSARPEGLGRARDITKIRARAVFWPELGQNGTESHDSLCRTAEGKRTDCSVTRNRKNISTPKTPSNLQATMD
ncbi:hypothetical protein C8F04DRAFT_1196706 [Mycena alexandri]|uniref:Uncharacterized protein n=1 Tax=Mycena alexandri TaxID=1745969 RepID=A0AAD6WQW9_9AGAR|nr:hypothetical protein C8F04DRAFT_1196706 [Mycena alexandri]